MAVVAFLLAPLPTPEALMVCGGTQTTGPDGQVDCDGLAIPPLTPIPDRSYRPYDPEP